MDIHTKLLIISGRICPYCNKPSIHVSDSEIYSISFGGFAYLCRECNAYVGCHKDRPYEALGRLANKELREAKINAHASFDNLWNRKIAKGFKKAHCKS